MVGAELGSAVVGQQREEQRAEHTALWGPCAQCGSSKVDSSVSLFPLFLKTRAGGLKLLLIFHLLVLTAVVSLHVIRK